MAVKKAVQTRVGSALNLPQHHPATFRLPRPAIFKRDSDGNIVERIPAERDPHFGLTRQFFYNLVKKGELKLLKFGGVSLIPYAKVAALIAKQANGGGE
jgi:hypothetical protein